MMISIISGLIVICAGLSAAVSLIGYTGNYIQSNRFLMDEGSKKDYTGKAYKALGAFWLSLTVAVISAVVHILSN